MPTEVSLNPRWQPSASGAEYAVVKRVGTVFVVVTPIGASCALVFAGGSIVFSERAEVTLCRFRGVFGLIGQREFPGLTRRRFTRRLAGDILVLDTEFTILARLNRCSAVDATVLSRNAVDTIARGGLSRQCRVLAR